MPLTLELLTLELLPMMRSKTITYLTCTSDRCGNTTTKHQPLTLEELLDLKLAGEGWYRCICCGTLRQNVRYQSGRYLPPKNY